MNSSKLTETPPATTPSPEENGDKVFSSISVFILSFFLHIGFVICCAYFCSENDNPDEDEVSDGESDVEVNQPERTCNRGYKRCRG